MNCDALCQGLTSCSLSIIDSSVVKLLLSENLNNFLANLPLGASAGALKTLHAHQFNEVKKTTDVSEAQSLLSYRDLNQMNSF